MPTIDRGFEAPFGATGSFDWSSRSGNRWPDPRGYVDGPPIWLFAAGPPDVAPFNQVQLAATG